MLSNEEYTVVSQNAYIPEHLPRYVEAVSTAEPHLFGAYLCFTRENHLIFIGYPLGAEESDISSSYESICEHFRPSTVAIIAPDFWLPAQSFEKQTEDIFYRLNLPLGPLSPEVAYMVRRAARELHITQGRFEKEHMKLVKEFISGHKLSQEHRIIFEHIPHYLKKSKSARLLEARKGNSLVAFNIIELESANYAFFLFNIRSIVYNIPGASDLLFHEMVKLAQSEGKIAINLGLGIHPGVRHFKEKWGGIPFLKYTYTLVHRQPIELGSLVEKL